MLAILMVIAALIAGYFNGHDSAAAATTHLV
jgi:hypothetical protein